MRVGWLAVIVVALAACPKDKGKVEGKHEAPVAAPIVLPPPVQPPFEVPAPVDPVVSIGRFWSHACVVRASGVVDCWGNPDYLCFRCPGSAQTGAVWRAAGVTDAVTIDVHGRCVLRKTGEAMCLDGKTRTFAPVPRLTKIIALTYSCFLVEGGRVFCETESGKPPELVKGVRDVVAIVEYGPIAGQKCAVTRRGRVWCSRFGGVDHWEQIPGLDHVDELTIAKVSFDELRACARRGEQVSCFVIERPYEDGKYGTVRAHKKVDVPELTGARQLSSGLEPYTFIVEGLVNGKVVSWRHPSEPPLVRTVPNLIDAVQHVFGCAVRAQGSVVCWGTNRSAALAQPTTLGEEHVPPTPVPGLRDIVDIAIGTTVGYALTRAGQVFRWGSRDDDPRTRLELMDIGAGPQLLVQIEADDSEQLCMRSANGLVWCEVSRGYNDLSLVQIATEGAQSIAVGKGRLLVIRAEGTVEWREIRNDSHGNEDLKNETLAVRGALEAAASWVTCARTRTGNVDCMNPSSSGFPAWDHALAVFTDASGIAVADEFACAVKAGRVWCRVYDYDGMTKPEIEISGLSGVTDIAAADDSACAVHAGAISCWRKTKDNTFTKPETVIASGARRVELGAASINTMAEARQLHGPRPAGETGCALMLDATVTCWGANIYGEVGDGSLISSEIPIGVKL